MTVAIWRRRDVNGGSLPFLISLLICVAYPPVICVIALLCFGAVPGWLVFKSYVLEVILLVTLTGYLSAMSCLHSREVHGN